MRLFWKGVQYTFAVISVSPYRALDRHWSCWVVAVGVVAIAAVVAAGPGELIGLVGPDWASYGHLDRG